MATVPPSTGTQSITGAPARKRRFVGRVGASLIDVWRRVALSISVGLTALWRIPWLRTWRPTVRQEFVRHCWQVGIKALADHSAHRRYHRNRVDIPNSLLAA